MSSMTHTTGFADNCSAQKGIQMAENLPRVYRNCNLVQFGIFWTVGQICSATSRLIIQEGIADKFFARLKQRTEEIVVGNPLEEETRLGPLVNEAQYQKVLGYIEVSSTREPYILQWNIKNLCFHAHLLPGFNPLFCECDAADPKRVLERLAAFADPFVSAFNLSLSLHLYLQIYSDLNVRCAGRNAQAFPTLSNFLAFWISLPSHVSRRGQRQEAASF